MKKSINLFLILFSSIALMSCASLTTHQTGRTIGKNKASLGLTVDHMIVDSNRIYPIDSGSITIPTLTTYFGVGEKLDIGLDVNITTFMNLHAKYQFIGDQESKFASSIGIDLGTPSVWMLVAGGTFNSSVSLYYSYHFNRLFAVSLTPRYTYIGSLTDDYVIELNYTEDDIHAYGYTAGIFIGDIHQFSLIYSQFVTNQAFDFNTSPILGIGYQWKFNLTSN